MSTSTKKATTPLKKFPTRTVTAVGYNRVTRVATKLVTTVLPDLNFKICTGCNHWVNPVRENNPTVKCLCCRSAHNIPKPATV